MEEVITKISQGQVQQAFLLAAQHGYLHIINRLIELSSDNGHAMIQAENYQAFRRAAMNGYLDIVNRIIELSSNNDVQAMIQANDYEAFRWAALYGRLDIVNRIIELSSNNDVQAMIQANDHEAFRWAAMNGHLDMMNHLLSFFPTLLPYAEMRGRKYSGYVRPFIQTQLQALHTRALEAESEHAVFNVDDEEAQRCFYIMCFLIRQNPPGAFDELRFLMGIPAVKALLHTEVTPNQPNELLRLAQTTGNRGAAEILLTVPAVRALAADRESPMRLSGVYQPKIQQAGGIKAVVVESFKATPRVLKQPSYQAPMNSQIQVYVKAMMASLERVQSLSDVDELKTLLLDKLLEHSQHYLQGADLDAYKKACHHEFTTLHEKAFEHALNPDLYTLFQQIHHAFHCLFELIEKCSSLEQTTKQTKPSMASIFSKQPEVTPLAKALDAFQQSLDKLDDVPQLRPR